MSDKYYSERRAVSREMRRMEARRKMAIVAAIGCILTAITIAIVSVIEIAEAKAAYKERTDDPVDVTIVIDDVEQYEDLDDYPLLGFMPPKVTDKKQINREPSYNEYDLELLALVIYQEAGGDACSDETRRMVAEVALNRVDHPIYPDTLEEVLTQYGQYGLLYWTGLVWPKRAQYAAEQHAVERAYRIAKEVLTSDERLLPGDVLFQAEFPQGKETVAEQNGLYFCR